MSDAAPPRTHSESFYELRIKVIPEPPPEPPPTETEPPAEFIQRWLDGIDAADALPSELTARAAGLAWELQQGDLALKALRAEAAERAVRERLDEVEQLGQELLLGPAGPPSVLLRRLESTPEGCRWLHDRWMEFVTGLDLGKLWCPADLLRLVRLMGKHPADAGYDESLNAVMSAFDARCCGFAELVFKNSQANLAADVQQPWRAWAADVPEASGFDEYLVNLVGGHLGRLKKRVHALESESSPTAACSAAADPRVMALQRLQLARSRELRLALDVLRKLRAAKPADRGVPARASSVSPRQEGKEIREPAAATPRPRPARSRTRRPVRTGNVGDRRSDHQLHSTPRSPARPVAVAAGSTSRGQLPP
jgi:hypothetical protein